MPRLAPLLEGLTGSRPPSPPPAALTVAEFKPTGEPQTQPQSEPLVEEKEVGSQSTLQEGVPTMASVPPKPEVPMEVGAEDPAKGSTGDSGGAKPKVPARKPKGASAASAEEKGKIPTTTFRDLDLDLESNSEQIHLNSPPQEFTKQQPKK